MRFKFLVLLTVLCCQIGFAQNPLQPGQLANDTASPIASPLPAPDHVIEIMSVPTLIQDRHERLISHFWVTSMVAMVTATSADAATSWGKREGNSLLASSDGTFGARGVSIKAGMAGAVLIPQLLLRHRANLRGKFILCNFVEAGVYAGVSLHNLTIPSGSR